MNTAVRNISAALPSKRTRPASFPRCRTKHCRNCSRVRQGTRCSTHRRPKVAGRATRRHVRGAQRRTRRHTSFNFDMPLPPLVVASFATAENAQSVQMFLAWGCACQASSYGIHRLLPHESVRIATLLLTSAFDRCWMGPGVLMFASMATRASALACLPAHCKHASAACHATRYAACERAADMTPQRWNQSRSSCRSKGSAPTRCAEAPGDQGVRC